MPEYHFTDQLGQAVTGARKAAAEALDQLVALDQELAAEREMHRAEVRRLVERAEAAEHREAELEDARDAAESSDDELGDQLENAVTERDTALERVTDLEAELERVQLAATAWQERADAATDAGVREAQRAETRERQLEDQVVGYQESLAQERERLTELERTGRHLLDVLRHNHTLSQYNDALAALHALVEPTV